MALIDEQNKLNQMHRNIPDIVEQMEENIINLEDIQEELTEQANAIEDAVCGVNKSDAIDLLENTVLPDHPTGDYVYYGPTFGIISFGDAEDEPPIPPGNLVDWAIMKTIPLLPDIPVYVYFPGDYPELDQWVSDYAWGNNYLTKPLDTSGTYGLYENIDQINTGLGVLNANKTVTAAGEDVLSRYLP
jgi:hypothetical protein